VEFDVFIPFFYMATLFSKWWHVTQNLKQREFFFIIIILN
jgi:hypothetical protein